MGFYTRTLRDYDGEKTTFRVNTPDLNAGNMAAQLVLQANFGAAVNDMVRGSLFKIAYGNEVNAAAAPPDDVFAQREMKWQVFYADTVTGEPHHITIGTADMEQLDPNNREQAYIGDGGVVDQFVTDFEAYVVSPAGNAVTITDIVLVGRNV